MLKFSKPPAIEKLKQEELKQLASSAWNVIMSAIDVSCPKVVDLGSGTGKHALFAPKDCFFVACDVFEEGSNYVRGDQHFVQCDIRKLPFNQSVFDAAICSHVIEHFVNPMEVMSQIRWILKANGVLYIETPNPTYAYFWDDYSHVRPYTAYALRSLLDSYGFRTLSYGEVPYPSRGTRIYRLLRLCNLEPLGRKFSLVLARIFRKYPYSYACGRKAV